MWSIAPPDHRGNQHAAIVGYGPSQPSVYNPVAAHYDVASPTYIPPPQWFEGMPTTGTPSVLPGAQVAAPAEAQVASDAVSYETRKGVAVSW